MISHMLLLRFLAPYSPTVTYTGECSLFAKDCGTVVRGTDHDEDDEDEQNDDGSGGGGGDGDDDDDDDDDDEVGGAAGRDGV